MIPRHYHVAGRHEQSQSRSPQYKYTYQIWWKSIEIYSSYCPESKIQMYFRQINSVKNRQNLSISNPKTDLQNFNAHTKFGENPLIFTKVIFQKWKYGCGRGQITLSKIDEICPLTIPNQISTMSMHTPSLMKIHWHLVKLSSGNENTDGRMIDGPTHGQPMWYNTTPPLSCGGV